MFPSEVGKRYLRTEDLYDSMLQSVKDKTGILKTLRLIGPRDKLQSDLKREK